MDVCYSSLDCESHTQKSNPTKLFQAVEPDEQGIEILYAKNMIDEHEEYSFIHKELNPPNQPQPFNLYTGISKNRISSERVEAVSKPKNKKNQRTPHPLNPSSQVTRACKKSHGLVVIVSIVIPFAITDVQIVRLPKMIKLAWLFSIKSNPRLPFPTPM